MPHLDTAHVTSCRSPSTHAHRSQAVQSLRHSPHRHRWGFCTIRSPLAACRRRVVVLMTPFPPFGGSEATTRGGVAPKVQTTSVKNAENGLLWARWTAFWAKQCRTCASFAREPLNIRVSPLMRTSTPRHAPGRRCPRPYHRVNVRVIEPTCASKGPSHHLSGPGAQQVARTRISGQRAQ